MTKPKTPSRKRRRNTLSQFSALPLAETIRARGSTARIAVGCEQQPEHPTDQPAEQRWRQLLRCAVACHGGSSRHDVRPNFADRFRLVVRRQIRFVLRTGQYCAATQQLE